jgi:NADH dehydrogenase FAD-containing subunit
MGKHLVFVGGGHAHLTSLKNLGNFIRRDHQVTLISLSAYHYYSGMGPGMLSGIYRPQEVRFHVKKLVEDRGGRFMEDKVTRIDPIGRLLFLHSGKEVNYDIVSFNTGSEVPAESLIKTPQENVLPVKPVINLLNARQFVLNVQR